MLVMGDIKCLHCAHVSGRWVGAKGAPLTVSGLRGYQLSEGEDPQRRFAVRVALAPSSLMMRAS